MESNGVTRISVSARARRMRFQDAGGQGQAFESNGAALSYGLGNSTAGSPLNSVSHHGQAKLRIALIPSQSARNQVSCLVAQTNIARSKLALPTGSRSR